MDLATRKLNAIGYLINLQDEKIISKIEAAISECEKQNEITDRFKPFTQKQLLSRAKRSNKDYLAGNFKNQDQLENESENW